jgi:hypothetical protein
MHNHGIRHTHRKLIQDFLCFFMPSFIGLNLLLCGVFWERRFCFITSYELPITFPHQEIHNPKFSTLVNFSCLISQLQFEKNHPPFFKATLNVFLGFLGLGLGFSFLRFLRLGLGLNKMDLVYVCVSSII